MTGAGICKMALVKLGVLEDSEALTASMLQNCMTNLGMMIDSWSFWQDLIWFQRTELFDLVAGQLEYTIGPSGDFDMTPRPIKIITAMLRIQPGNPQPADYYLEQQAPSDYAQIGIKRVQAYPRQFGYNPTVPTASMKFWPIPDQSYQVLLTMHMPFAAIEDNVEVSCPPGFIECIVYNLAVLVASDYGTVASQVVQNRAIFTMAKLKQGNYSTMARRVSPDESAPGFPEFTGVPYAWGYPP